jgi:hypothetical protein
MRYNTGQGGGTEIIAMFYLDLLGFGWIRFDLVGSGWIRVGFRLDSALIGSGSYRQ